MPNPILIELWRGPLVESIHRGAIAIVDAKGAAVLTIGDVATPVFPRSAVKPLQALPLIATGAAERYRFGDAEIALACGSHTGTPGHIEVAAGMLARAGLAERTLACGAHSPLDSGVSAELAIRGEQPRSLHNNCSGKHAAMLASAAHMGEPIDGYWRPDHPVQTRVRRAIEALSSTTLGPEVTGIDGCSVPNWAMPLRDLAGAFARFTAGQQSADTYAAAADQITRACWARPELVGGQGRLDTVVMAKLPGRIFMKTGAEGVYCAGLPQHGLGLAIKIDDGAKRAAEAVTMIVLARFLPEAGELQPDLLQRNWRGIVTGSLRPAADLLQPLDGRR